MWDDPFSGPPCFQTYAHVLQTAETIADCLSRHRMRDGHPIAIFGHNCPPVLAAVLATLSLPSHDVGGVACVPMNPDDPSTDQASCLQRCGVELVLVELSVMEVGYLKGVLYFSSLAQQASLNRIQGIGISSMHLNRRLVKSYYLGQYKLVDLDYGLIAFCQLIFGLLYF